MKTIRIIDILINIANKKEVPKMVKYNNYILTYDVGTQDYYNEPECTYSLLDDVHQKLTDKVEIVEDTTDDKIEKLDLDDLKDLLRVDLNYELLFHKIHKMLIQTKSKINEIIDKTNEKEENNNDTN